MSIDLSDSTLDVNEHAVIVDYTGGPPLASIKSAVTPAYNKGSWTGFGITSSLANNSTHGVGYAESGAVFASFPATFAGEAIDDTAVLVRLARYGERTWTARSTSTTSTASPPTSVRAVARSGRRATSTTTAA